MIRRPPTSLGSGTSEVANGDGHLARGQNFLATLYFPGRTWPRDGRPRSGRRAGGRTPRSSSCTPGRSGTPMGSRAMSVGRCLKSNLSVSVMSEHWVLSDLSELSCPCSRPKSAKTENDLLIYAQSGKSTLGSGRKDTPTELLRMRRVNLQSVASAAALTSASRRLWSRHSE